MPTLPIPLILSIAMASQFNDRSVGISNASGVERLAGPVSRVTYSLARRQMLMEHPTRLELICGSATHSRSLAKVASLRQSAHLFRDPSTDPKVICMAPRNKTSSAQQQLAPVRKARTTISLETMALG